jgi:squalene synthase HpnC
MEAAVRPPAEVPSSAGVMRQARTENFPVASRLLPPTIRLDLLAVYGFARLVDDLGDEAAGDRLALLDWLDGEVDALYQGQPTHPVMRRLASTVRRRRIPEGPLRALIAANRQDQVVSTYPTYRDLAAYCELSANPVGHLVLHVAGAATPERFALSDQVCTGLQLVEHWQDVAEDQARGRVYIPQEDMARFRVSAEDLAAPRASPALRTLMAFEVERARDLLRGGAPLARTLPGRLRLAIVAFVAGGLSALDAMERTGFDVLARRPRPSRRAKLLAMVRTAARDRLGR